MSKKQTHRVRSKRPQSLAGVRPHKSLCQNFLIDEEVIQTIVRESGVTEETFEQLFAPALETAEKYGMGLYCGEYGVIDIVAPEDAVKWFRVINKVFEKHGIARAAWSYREMDFGIADARWDAVRDELIKVL